MTYQARGDFALNSQHYTQAVQDFSQAMSHDPEDPLLYLHRGTANFELGHYENALTDYSQYLAKTAEPFVLSDFSLGFAKGLPKGVYESGKGTMLFLSEFATHPIQTSLHMIDSLTQLATLVKNDQLGDLAEALSPELHQLVTQWDSLSSDVKGELAGYALGKLGTDVLAPGAIAKVASKSVNSAKELTAICKNIQVAQEVLVLETASGVGAGVRLSEIIDMGKKTVALGEELGFSPPEMGQLHKGFMSESEARALIHQTGIKTFPRPHGIPDNFRVQISDKGAGMKYVHPSHTHTSVRVMPGKPHSSFSYQQKPYINQRIDGQSIDKYGNYVPHNSSNAHIPFDEFIYRE